MSEEELANLTAAKRAEIDAVIGDPWPLRTPEEVRAMAPKDFIRSRLSEGEVEVKDAEISSLRHRVAELESHLRGFVSEFDKHNLFADIPDEDADRHILEGEASLSQIRRARKALEEQA